MPKKEYWIKDWFFLTIEECLWMHEHGYFSAVENGAVRAFIKEDEE